MIPFGSQRASGQDLATHLLNAQDNEQIETASVRGAVADDLHGAFAEWEALAHALTRCRKYLYSLSVNPDPRQGRLSRAQYEDYIARVEDRLGLTGQPRAVVFHVKDGREHCHVVWSRIDAGAGKAVPIAFDREKLMAVTREFAADHGLQLPPGYYEYPDPAEETGQLSLYEKVQEERTGLSKEERIEAVTRAWQQSDGAKAFVNALEELGYVLATGKRPFVVVDADGEVSALPRLIARDGSGAPVRAKDVRARLEAAFPPESLPTVEQAKELAAQHRQARQDRDKPPPREDETAALEARQAVRREPLTRLSAALKANHAAEEMHLAARQDGERRALEDAIAAEIARLRHEREAHRPTGLAAFLGRVTGMDFLRKALRVRQDARRRRIHAARRAALTCRHVDERRALKARQELERLDMARHLRALRQIERRERQSLTTARRRTRGQTGGSGSGALQAGANARQAAPNLHGAFAHAAEPVTTGGDEDGEAATEGHGPADLWAYEIGGSEEEDEFEWDDWPELDTDYCRADRDGEDEADTRKDTGPGGPPRPGKRRKTDSGRR